MNPLTRRDFLGFIVPLAASPLVAGMDARHSLPASTVVGALSQTQGRSKLPDAAQFRAEKPGDGLFWLFSSGALADSKYITADFLLYGDTLVVFCLSLREGERSRTFRFIFGALNECSFRLRMPLALVNQNVLVSNREGALLLPMTEGDVVDLRLVDRVSLTILRKAEEPTTWEMTALTHTSSGVPALTRPLLPQGPLLDEMGQSRIRRWPSKTKSVKELKTRLDMQWKSVPEAKWPRHFSRWGGWNARKLADGTGFFRTHHDGRRWWFVDPDGFAFWSAGVDCVRIDCTTAYAQLESALSWIPDRNSEFEEVFSMGKTDRGDPMPLINYSAANLIRAFGRDHWRGRWADIAFAQLRRTGFNTVGNWSDWQIASGRSVAYVRPLEFAPRRVPLIYRELPDVFHPAFDSEAADFATQLLDSVQDPALIGYFLMNEPTWGFSTMYPAEGILYNSPPCHTRDELVLFLKRKYATGAALSTAWKMAVTFERIAKEKWRGPFSDEARADLRLFSALLVEAYFSKLSAACRKVDPNHLNLGIRWAGVPPEWAIAGMKSFDVFSQNCYQSKFPIQVARRVEELLNKPCIVGEYHFGALDAGLPGSGIRRVETQQDRGRAYRVYLEDAAADPHCVGAHWFILYDESALGRYDGENYNVGFLDVCHRPYESLAQAARESHGRMYRVASGELPAFKDAPQYLPPVF